MKRLLFGLLLTATTLASASAQTAEIQKEVDDKLKSLRTDDEIQTEKIS